MENRKALSIILLISITFLFNNSFTYSQQENLPVNPDVKIGYLDNGIKYYILENKKPEKRCELRLIVNAGSVLENDDQKGLAHFVEHMAFNGSTHFKKNELINYLESIGVKFGPELNAYTSFDETVYMLQVPTDKPDLVEKGFLVLSDWASGLAFDSIEIEKERGVITEEWRLGRGAQMRMLDKQLPIIFKNSHYADRLTIGDIEVIKNFKHETLKNFYRDWYRPDLMAVVAVGDFDKLQIENLIKQNFENIKQPNNIRERTLFPVPKHKETLFAITSDKEAANTTVSLYFKQDVQKTLTISDYKIRIINNLFSGMLTKRFQELTMLPNPPFINAMAGRGSFCRTSDINMLNAMVKDGGIQVGLETLVREAERVRLFGFTSTELERQKQILLRNAEQQLAEKDKTESSQLINQFVGNFLNQNPIMGYENTYKILKEILPKITLEDVNKLVNDYVQTENRVVVISMPEKEGLNIPLEKELSEVINKVSGEKITAYEDKVSNQPLIKEIPKPGKIISETKNEKPGFTEWKLSNGARVLVKKTDYKNDEIVVRAFSNGGTSLAEDKNYIASVTAAGLINESGLGNFSLMELQKLLAGKVISLSPIISQYYEGLSGGCSPRDIETFMQMLYIGFSSPRIDSNAFLSFKTKIASRLENAGNDPQSVFSDTLNYLASNYHFRNRPWNLSTLSEMNLNESIKFFKERFADASDFTFIFVGNVDEIKFKPLVETYIGSLPPLNRNENFRDLNYTTPSGIVEKRVEKGIEQKSSVAFVYAGSFEWSRENEYKLEALIDVMNIRLREVIREEKGGTYGVRVSYSSSKYPVPKYSINISWGCNPERVDELVNAMFSTIDSVKRFGPSVETLNKVKETQRRQREVKVQQNNFWAGMLFNYLLNGEDPALIAEYNNWIDKLTIEDIKYFANKYIKSDNFIKCVLYPEKTK
jgi:zinc protease